MKHSNEIPAPTKPLMAGCQQEPCSLSSGSEVDAAFPLSTNWYFPDSPKYLQQRAVALKLENERNKMTAFASDLTAELREVRTAIRAYRDAKGRYHTQLACERLLALLPENRELSQPPVGITDANR
jgi:hypothetical protein